MAKIILLFYNALSGLVGKAGTQENVILPACVSARSSCEMLLEEGSVANAGRVTVNKCTLYKLM